MGRRGGGLAVVLVAAACVSSGPPSPPGGEGAAPATPDAATSDAAAPDGASAGLDASAPGPPPPDAGVHDAVEEPTAPPTDAHVDASQVPKPFPPLVLGPPFESYDCRAERASLPGRVSPVPIDCPLRARCREPMVVGHRGVGGDFGGMAPENSLAAIRAAIVAGLDGVELDVRETADEVLVLMHDGTVDRTTYGLGPVSGFTLAEITELALRPPPLGPADGYDFTCERVPTLAEALALCKDRVFVDIDMKTGRVDLVVAAVLEAGMVDQAYLSTPLLHRALEARRIEAAIRVQVRPRTLEEVYAATEAFGRWPPEVYEVGADFAAEAAEHVHGLGRALFANAWEADALTYFDDDPAHYLGLYAAGVDILQSEYPTQLLEILGRARWRGAP